MAFLYQNLQRLSRFRGFFPPFHTDAQTDTESNSALLYLLVPTYAHIHGVLVLRFLGI